MYGTAEVHGRVRGIQNNAVMMNREEETFFIPLISLIGFIRSFNVFPYLFVFLIMVLFLPFVHRTICVLR